MNALELKKFCTLRRNYKYVFLKPTGLKISDSDEFKVIADESKQFACVMAMSDRAYAICESTFINTKIINPENVRVIETDVFKPLMDTANKFSVEQTEAFIDIYNSTVLAQSSQIAGMVEDTIYTNNAVTTIKTSVGDTSKYFVNNNCFAGNNNLHFIFSNGKDYTGNIAFEDYIGACNITPLISDTPHLYIGGHLIEDTVINLNGILSNSYSLDKSSTIEWTDIIVYSVVTNMLSLDTKLITNVKSSASGIFGLVRYASNSDYDELALNNLDSDKLKSLNYIEIL